MIKNELALRKAITCFLRHRRGIVDNSGWAEIWKLFTYLKKQEPDLSKDELKCILSKDKERYEMKSNKVRVKKGHKNGVIIEGRYEVPPDILYFGGRISELSRFLSTGVKEDTRVRLAENRLDAVNGINRDKSVVLRVNARAMFREGYKFYKSKYGEWYVSYIPVKYIYLVG